MIMNLLYATARRKNLGRARLVSEVPATGRLPARTNIRRVGHSVVNKKKKARGRPRRPIRMLISNELPTNWPARILTTYVSSARVAAPHSHFERVRCSVADVHYHSRRAAGGVADSHSRR